MQALLALAGVFEQAAVGAVQVLFERASEQGAVQVLLARALAGVSEPAAVGAVQVLLGWVLAEASEQGAVQVLLERAYEQAVVGAVHVLFERALAGVSEQAVVGAVQVLLERVLAVGRLDAVPKRFAEVGQRLEAAAGAVELVLCAAVGAVELVLFAAAGPRLDALALLPDASVPSCASSMF